MFGSRHRRGTEGVLFGRFTSCLASVEEGKERLLAAVPTARRSGIAPAEGLLGFEECLREARDAMPGWRDGLIDDEWRACDEAIGEALRRAEALRLEAPALEFEALLAAFGDLMAPLDAFEDAAERLGKRDR
jgi:hypothetical protein